VKPVRTLVRTLAVLPARGYRVAISPLFPPACRFYPSCSRYAEEAVLSHGIVRGGWLAMRRLLRCHPWSEIDVDPVPTASR